MSGSSTGRGFGTGSGAGSAQPPSRSAAGAPRNGPSSLRPAHRGAAPTSTAGSSPCTRRRTACRPHAIQALDDHELAAVLAHEDAHLRERHHLVSTVMASVTTCLSWVPLVSAAADALPSYLEIAADDRARRRAGTPALVSALLKLGERTHAGLHGMESAPALHAAGPERIRQLVQPVTGGAGAAPALTLIAFLVTLALLVAAVLVPYASASLTGCL